VASQPAAQDHGIDRFVDEVITAGRKGLGQVTLLTCAGHEKDWRDFIGIHRSYDSAKLHTTRPRHFYVQEECVDSAFAGNGNGLVRGLCLEHGVALTFYHRCNRASDKIVIVHDED